MSDLPKWENGDPDGLPILCIAGPTASGKTALALRCAERMNGEIVNADALQVYADLTILSARPSEAEMASVPHHLFGHVDGAVAYSTGAWLRDAVPVIEAIHKRGRTPILVGGTGLYFKALLEGLAEVPDVPKSAVEAAVALPVEALRAEAERLDPVATARVLGDDPQRLARIVSVAQSTGRPLSEWWANTQPAMAGLAPQCAVLLPPRDVLYERINQRFDAMMLAGALDEAKAVAARDLPARAPMLKAIGLSHLLRHLDGELSLDDAIDLAKRDSRRLAKRQSTWFRNQTPDWPVLESEADQAAWVEALS